jgi:hypothetical protein
MTARPRRIPTRKPVMSAWPQQIPARELHAQRQRGDEHTTRDDSGIGTASPAASHQWRGGSGARATEIGVRRGRGGAWDPARCSRRGESGEGSWTLEGGAGQEVMRPWREKAMGEDGEREDRQGREDKEIP